MQRMLFGCSISSISLFFNQFSISVILACTVMPSLSISLILVAGSQQFCSTVLKNSPSFIMLAFPTIPQLWSMLTQPR